MEKYFWQHMKDIKISQTFQKNMGKVSKSLQESPRDSWRLFVKKSENHGWIELCQKRLKIELFFMK